MHMMFSFLFILFIFISEANNSTRMCLLDVYFDYYFLGCSIV